MKSKPIKIELKKNSSKSTKLAQFEAQTCLTDKFDPLNPRPKSLGPTHTFGGLRVKF